MKQLLAVILGIICLNITAKTADSDYDALSSLSSQQLMDSGRDYFGKREAGKALARFLIVSERHKQSNKKEDVQLSIRALNNCACVYKYFYFDYAQAYEYFTQAYDLCKQAHYDEFLPVVMVNLGDLLNDYGISYNSQALSQQAQDIFEQCMEQAVTSQNWDLMTTAFFNLANQNYTLKLDKYKTIFDEKIPKDTRDLQYIRLQYHGLENIQQGNYAKARDYFQQQLAAVTAQWEPERDTLATYMSIAHTYRMENDYKNETEYLEKAFQMASSSNVGDQATSICKLLADSYQQQGHAAALSPALSGKERRGTVQQTDEYRRAELHPRAETRTGEGQRTGCQTTAPADVAAGRLHCASCGIRFCHPAVAQEPPA